MGQEKQQDKWMLLTGLWAVSCFSLAPITLGNQTQLPH